MVDAARSSLRRYYAALDGAARHPYQNFGGSARHAPSSVFQVIFDF
jgi:hypothetical protein